MKHYLSARHAPIALAAAAAVAAVTALLAGCASTPLPPETVRVQPAPAPAAQGPADRVVAPTHAASSQVSYASNPRAYRADAAEHIYSQNKARIYKGRLPPLLYAIGVLQVDVDGRGNVERIRWMRAPTHAPEVIHEIEHLVRAAAPFPVPARMGHVTYTDTWLWHKSGKFQLDTLTEGQD
jgi:hypothetical protein